MKEGGSRESRRFYNHANQRWAISLPQVFTIQGEYVRVTWEHPRSLLDKQSQVRYARLEISSGLPLLGYSLGERVVGCRQR